MQSLVRARNRSLKVIRVVDSLAWLARSRPRFHSWTDFLHGVSVVVSQIVNEKFGARSGSVAVVVVEHSAESGSASHLAFSRADGSLGCDEVVADALMIAL